MVEPDRHPSQRPPVPIDEHRAVELPGQPDAGDLRRIDPLERLPRCNAQAVPPILPVLLDPARMGFVQRVFRGAPTDDLSPVVQQHRLGASRAQVDP